MNGNSREVLVHPVKSNHVNFRQCRRTIFRNAHLFLCEAKYVSSGIMREMCMYSHPAVSPMFTDQPETKKVAPSDRKSSFLYSASKISGC